MQPVVLTWYPCPKPDPPVDMVMVPKTTTDSPDIPVMIKDEAGCRLGWIMARQNPEMPPGVFWSSSATADRLGLEEGFSYRLEPIGYLPPLLTSAVLQFHGRTPLAGLKNGTLSELRTSLRTPGSMIVAPSQRLVSEGETSFELTDRVEPSGIPPPWLVSPQTHLSIMDSNGPLDLILAIDGPSSIRKQDLARGKTGAGLSHARAIANSAGAIGEVLSGNINPGRLGLFFLEEKAHPLRFHDATWNSPWLDCHGRVAERIAPLVREMVLSRIDGSATTSRNLGESLNDMLHFLPSPSGARSGTLATVILVTDGRYTEGPNPVAVMREHGQGAPGHVLHVVGLGDEVEESILRRCAQLGRGRYQRVTDGKQLESVIRNLSSRFIMTLD